MEQLSRAGDYLRRVQAGLQSSERLGILLRIGYFARNDLNLMRFCVVISYTDPKQAMKQLVFLPREVGKVFETQDAVSDESYYIREQDPEELIELLRDMYPTGELLHDIVPSGWITETDVSHLFDIKMENTDALMAKKLLSPEFDETYAPSMLIRASPFLTSYFNCTFDMWDRPRSMTEK